MKSQNELDSNRLVFIDESGAKTNMTRLYGRSPRGKRVYDKAPHGHWCTTTMIASVRHDGSSACMTVDGPTTGEIFRIYVEKILAPTLDDGDLVILDNLSAHRDKQARQFIEARGASLLFLPAYSPDLNPIEKMWSKIKQIIRSQKPRTEEALLASIAYSLENISSENAKNWFISCGYSFS